MSIKVILLALKHVLYERVLLLKAAYVGVTFVFDIDPPITDEAKSAS